MKFTIELGNDQVNEIKSQLIPEIEDNITTDKLKQRLGTNQFGFKEILRLYNLADKVEKLDMIAVRDLTDNQKLMLMMYWTMKGIGF